MAVPRVPKHMDRGMAVECCTDSGGRVSRLQDMFERPMCLPTTPSRCCADDEALLVRGPAESRIGVRTCLRWTEGAARELPLDGSG